VTLEIANLGFFFNKSIDVMQSIIPQFQYEDLLPVNLINLSEILRLYKKFFFHIGLHGKVKLIGLNKRVSNL